jgi:hypothetical protein
MKTKRQALRSLTTVQLKELADVAHRPSRPTPDLPATGPQPTPPKNGAQTPLAAAPLWQLKDNADALRQNQPEAGPKPQVHAAPRRKAPHLFEQLVQMLLRKPPQGPAPRQAPHGPKSASEDGRVPTARAMPSATSRGVDRDVHTAAKQTVGETILGAVTLNDVLKELERRGVNYRPPVDEKGVLTIEESDLIPTKGRKHAKLRPGIGKYLKGHPGELTGIRVNAAQPVDLGWVRMPRGFIESAGPVRANHLEVKQLHSVGNVTVEEFLHAGVIQAKGDVTAREILTKECTVYGNITCAETLKFAAGSAGSKQTVTGSVQCGHLVSEDDRLVHVDGAVTVKGNCSAPQLAARDLSVGWELQNAKRLWVTGKANLTRLSPSIDAEAEFQGVALQEYLQQLRGMREELREQSVLKKIRAATEGASVEWTAEEKATQAYQSHFEPGQDQKVGRARSRRDVTRANGNHKGVPSRGIAR